VRLAELRERLQSLPIIYTRPSSRHRHRHHHHHHHQQQQQVIEMTVMMMMMIAVITSPAWSVALKVGDGWQPAA